MTYSALVTDGEQRAALAVARSLGLAGYQVHVCSSRRRSLAGGSRYTSSETLVPDPLSDPVEFVRQLEEIVTRLSPQLLLPIADASILPVLADRRRFSDALIPFPDSSTYGAISDKAKLSTVAPNVGLAVPKQVVLTDSRALTQEVAGSLTLPLVVKPSKSVTSGTKGNRKLSVRHAATVDDVERIIGELPESAFPVLLQQRVVGPGIGVFLLVWDNEAIAVFGHRRIREKPPSGGVSTYRESVAVDPELAERSLQLLKTFGWQGVAMVEYKIDEKRATPYIMEVNGRFWGSLQLAIDCEVDFPRLLCEAALGRKPQPINSYLLGRRCRWWWGDVDQLLARLLHSRKALHLTPDEGTRLSAMLDFCRSGKNDRTEVLRFSDMRPFVRETTQWVAALLPGRKSG